MEEIDLKEIFEVFWEKKVTIILLTAIFMVVGFIYSSFMVVPKYSSSTTLVLAQSANQESSTGITATDVNLNSKLIATYSKLVKSNGVVRQVISNLGIDDTEASVKANVSVSAEEGTDIIKIVVTNTEAEKAANIANEMAAVFTEKVKEIYKLDNVYSLEPAEVSETPSNINHTKTMIIFAAIGFILGAGYVFVLFMLDNSVKSQEDVEKANIHVLASIPMYEAEQKAASRSARNQKRSKGGRR